MAETNSYLYDQSLIGRKKQTSSFLINRKLDEAVKRWIDISLATILIVIFCPIFMFIAILVRVSTGSHPIYAHRRVGRNGLPFSCYKFKSMMELSEEAFMAYLEAHPAEAQEWNGNRKLKSDPRVTPLGRYLRTSSLDELPQLFNVLKGDMSFVGPRPIVFAELEKYGAVARDYFGHRPGVTGLWQISGRNLISYDERVKYDEFYLRHRSVWRDLVIMARTVPAVARRAQAS